MTTRRDSHLDVQIACAVILFDDVLILLDLQIAACTGLGTGSRLAELYMHAGVHNIQHIKHGEQIDTTKQ